MATLPSDPSDPQDAGGFDPLQRFGQMGLTFDDVCLVPAASDVVPAQVSTRHLVAPGIGLAIPLMSAAMDTVTEARLAIAMAREGGPRCDPPQPVDRGPGHRGRQGQALRVRHDRRPGDTRARRPRRRRAGPDDASTGSRACRSSTKRRLVGILTNRDLRFEDDPEPPVGEVMTAEGLITARRAPPWRGPSILGRHRHREAAGGR